VPHAAADLLPVDIIAFLRYNNLRAVTNKGGIMKRVNTFPALKNFELMFRGVFFLVGLLVVALLINTAVSIRIDDYIKITGLPAHMSVKEREQQIQCMTQNIYWEAASEPFEGKVAVAQVTMNRMNSGKFPDTVCGVVQQRNVFYDKVVCQFSWFCESTYKTRPVHPKNWEESEAVAKKVLLEGFRLPSLKEALYYHADYVNPKWNKDKIGKIGQHIFYKDKI
jgi:spore germination cell wall hydrolase CwlJ-like protein